MSKDNTQFEEMGKESQFTKEKQKDQAYDKNNQKEHRI